jgi:3-phosphoshikimate 1-carboxyvinyltransferase
VWGAGELRVKESDRIAAIGSMLTCMGVHVEEHEDGLTVEGGRLRGDCEFDAMGDHRMAMSAAVAALVADGPVAIVGAEAADVSYPGFFKVLEGLRR